MDTSLYHPKWTLIRRLIRRRAGDCCEHCGIKQGTHQVKVGFRDWGSGNVFPQSPVDRAADRPGGPRPDPLPKPHYFRYRIWLAVAHLDQDRSNNRFDNLSLLCTRCHFKYDRGANLMRRKYGKHYLKGQCSLPLDIIG